MVEKLKEKEQKVLDTFEKVIPKLSEEQLERLLSFGEGMAYAKEIKDQKEAG